MDAYVAFVRDRSILEAIASSLTEMFSPTIIAERVSGMLANYAWITQDTLAYFTPRLTQAPRDVQFALGYVKEHARTRAEQDAGAGRAALQVRRAVVAARRAALCLCHARPDPARRLRAEPGVSGAADEAAVPALRRGVKFRFDAVRDAWVLLGPERLFVPDETAVEVLKLIDGARTLGAVIDDLAARLRRAARRHRRRRDRAAARPRRQRRGDALSTFEELRRAPCPARRRAAACRPVGAGRRERLRRHRA